jgi:hypothetical protein
MPIQPEPGGNPRAGGKVRVALAGLLVVLTLLASAATAGAADERDWITALPREPVTVAAWPGGKKVAVCFVLYVEVWGFGHGPNLRSDMVGRDPDVVDEAFREYAINWGVDRVGRLFKEQDLPLSLALNAEFPEQRPAAWKALRRSVPNAPIIAHGLNNSTAQLPLGRGLDAQAEYIRKTLDLIEKHAGVRPRGWSSPSVHPNADTFTASAAAGIAYTLDAMDSDVLSRLATKAGKLTLVPCPPQTIDMGHYLSRAKEPGDLERLWIDYVGELAREAEADPARPATVVAIGSEPRPARPPSAASSKR